MVRHDEPGEYAEMVAGPDSVDRFIEHPGAFEDVQAGSMYPRADEDVVDPAAEFEGHLASADQRVARVEGVARIPRMDGRPGVPVGDAQPVQGLAASPEAEAGRVGGVIEVAEHDDRLVAVRRSSMARAQATAWSSRSRPKPCS